MELQYCHGKYTSNAVLIKPDVSRGMFLMFTLINLFKF